MLQTAAAAANSCRMLQTADANSCRMLQTAATGGISSHTTSHFTGVRAFSMHSNVIASAFLAAAMVLAKKCLSMHTS